MASIELKSLGTRPRLIAATRVCARSIYILQKMAESDGTRSAARASSSKPKTLISLWSGASRASDSAASTSHASSLGERMAQSESDSVYTGTSTTSNSGDQPSSSESESDQGTIDSFSHRSAIQPARKKRKQQKLCFKEWKLRYLMLQASRLQSSDSVTMSCDEEMICIQCQERMKAKSSTATRHIERKHPTMAYFSQEKKIKLLRPESRLRSQQSAMAIAIKPDEMVKLAPYKLAFVISKHNMPFSSCEAFMEFAIEVQILALCFCLVVRYYNKAHTSYTRVLNLRLCKAYRITLSGH